MIGYFNIDISHPNSKCTINHHIYLKAMNPFSYFFKISISIDYYRKWIITNENKKLCDEKVLGKKLKVAAAIGQPSSFRLVFSCSRTIS